MVQATVTARVARGWTCCCHECDWSGCARGRKTCMLGAGPPRDGIIRTSPGQECSKDKGALPGARRIFVYAARFWSTAGPASTVWFKPYRLVLHLDEKRVSLYPAKRQAPVAQWIEHLITVQKVGGSSPSGRAAAPLGAIHRWGFCISTKHSFGSAYFMPSARGDPIRVTQGRCVLSWPRWCIAGEPSQGRGHGWRLKEKPPPLHETWGVMKLSSPQHAQNLGYRTLRVAGGATFWLSGAGKSVF